MTSITCTLDGDSVICNGTEYEPLEQDSVGSQQFYIDLGVSIGLVLCCAIFSGLTMGLLTLSVRDLEIKCKVGTPKEKKYAKRILPLCQKHHLLLVTLLLANAGAAEALPLFFDKLVSPAVAIVLSISAVLLFGEIFPQALCSKYGLAIGWAFAPLVWILMFVLIPIVYPIAKLLDLMLGTHEATFYRRAGLKELIQSHPISSDEITIISGALDMVGKSVYDVMTPIADVFMLDADDIMDEKLLRRVMHTGHSRIPVYGEAKQNILGVIYVKKLVLYDPDTNDRVLDLMTHELQICDGSISLFQLLDEFQIGHTHIMKVRDAVSGATVGIITLEDVIEELLQEEIEDETDHFNSVHSLLEAKIQFRNAAATAGVRRGRASASQSDHNDVTGNYVSAAHRVHVGGNSHAGPSVSVNNNDATNGKRRVEDPTVPLLGGSSPGGGSAV